MCLVASVCQPSTLRVFELSRTYAALLEAPIVTPATAPYGRPCGGAGNRVRATKRLVRVASVWRPVYAVECLMKFRNASL
jgi:hypothetical protein